MNYLVIRPQGKGQSAVSIISGDDVKISGEFTSWALNDGQKVLFANIKLHRTIKSSYMFGAFTAKAIYTYSYEEMCAIITSHIGPSDKALYESLTVDQESDSSNRYVTAMTLWLITENVLKLFVGAVRMVFTIVIIPIIIAFISKPK